MPESNNVIILKKTDGTCVYNPKIEKLEVIFNGKNNYIELFEPLRIERKLKIQCMGDNSYFSLGKNALIKTMSAYLSTNAKLIIGENFSCEAAAFPIRGDSKACVKIGNDCMFSYEIIVRNSDVHSIYDINSNKLVNLNKAVEIGDHVWLSARVMVLKGAKIPSGSIVGAYSLVTKKFKEENSIYAGQPAKLIKTAIKWDRKKVDFGI